MDNKKIGKLIADLRKKQGLTQQELGDKVGVGFRAVSKWERGLTLPDISIINELSKILGISSDELLTGKINKENKSKEKRKLTKKIKVTITVMISIIIVLTSIFVYYNNKTYIYDIASVESEKYCVKGHVIFKKSNISIIINEIKFKESQFSILNIKNYEYDISSNEEFIFRYGYSPAIDNIDQVITINEFASNFNMNHTVENTTTRKAILKNNIDFTFRFINENNEEITKNIKIELKTKEAEKE